jgi:hypothetical protein
VEREGVDRGRHQRRRGGGLPGLDPRVARAGERHARWETDSGLVLSPLRNGDGLRAPDRWANAYLRRVGAALQVGPPPLRSRDREPLVADPVRGRHGAVAGSAAPPPALADGAMGRLARAPPRYDRSLPGDGSPAPLRPLSLRRLRDVGGAPHSGPDRPSLPPEDTHPRASHPEGRRPRVSRRRARARGRSGRGAFCRARREDLLRPERESFSVEAPPDVEVVEGYWFAWMAFHPESSVFTGGAR